MFLKLIISLRGGYCNYSHRAPKSLAAPLPWTAFICVETKLEPRAPHCNNCKNRPN